MQLPGCLFLLPRFQLSRSGPGLKIHIFDKSPSNTKAAVLKSLPVRAPWSTHNTLDTLKHLFHLSFQASIPARLLYEWSFFSSAWWFLSVLSLSPGRACREPLRSTLCPCWSQRLGTPEPPKEQAGNRWLQIKGFLSCQVWLPEQGPL